MPALKKRTRPTKYIIDVSVATNDGIIDLSDFETFLLAKVKVNGKAGDKNFGEKVKISKEKDRRIAVHAEQPFSKRYLKYLTKKYLKKQALRDFLRIIATPNQKNSYELKYFEVGGAAEAESE